ncbi:hypothetical protein J6590_016632 [Homalodisca vitripennis]|nr:hypothetical protein J6590_016632 [Homalodisca vitripennis]
MLYLLVVVPLLGFFLSVRYLFGLRDLPPGPWGLPVLGSLLQLSPTTPYTSLTQLADKYGPIYSLQMGRVLAVVISDVRIIREALGKEELAGRADLYLTHGIMEGVMQFKQGLCKEVMQFKQEFCKGVMQFKQEFCKGLMQFNQEFCKRVMKFKQEFCKGVMQFNQEFCKRVMQFKQEFCKGVMQFKQEFCKGVMQFKQEFCKRVMQFKQEFCKGVMQFNQEFCKGVMQFNQEFCKGVKQFNQEFCKGVKQFRQGLCKGVMQFKQELCKGIMQFKQGLSNFLSTVLSVHTNSAAPVPPMISSVDTHTDRTLKRNPRLCPNTGQDNGREKSALGHRNVVVIRSYSSTPIP